MSAVRSIAHNGLTCAAVALLAACGQSADNTAADDAAPASGQQFRDSSELPDWNGWWEVEGGFEAVSAASQSGRSRDDDVTFLGVAGNPAIYQPEAQQILGAGRTPGSDTGGGSSYCIPHRFNGGFLGGFTNDVEFLLRPGRLTITNGDALLRRIVIDGSSLPENPEGSNGGTSVGRWEGDTLVIETNGLWPDTTFPVPSTPYLPPIGENVYVVERIRLNEDDKLIVESELTAPQLLIAPISFTGVYERDPGYVYRDHDICAPNDRSVDPETGFERFDLTPPANLPPPPPRPSN